MRLSDFITTENEYFDTEPWDWYGEMPKNCSRHQLVQILANGIRHFREDRKIFAEKGWEEPEPEGYSVFGIVSNIIDIWCDHDDNLSAMISPNEFDGLCREIVISLNNGL